MGLGKTIEAPRPTGFGRKGLPSGSEHWTKHMGNLKRSHKAAPVLTCAQLPGPNSSGCKWPCMLPWCLRAGPPTMGNYSPGGKINLYEMRPGFGGGRWPLQSLRHWFWLRGWPAGRWTQGSWVLMALKTSVAFRFQEGYVLGIWVNPLKITRCLSQPGGSQDIMADASCILMLAAWLESTGLGLPCDTPLLLSSGLICSRQERLGRWLVVCKAPQSHSILTVG